MSKQKYLSKNTIVFVITSVSIALVAILLIVFVSYKSITELNELNQLTITQNEQQRNLDFLLSEIRSHHGNILDYVVTKDSAYLQGADRDRDNIRQKLDRLVEQNQNNQVSSQLELFASLVNGKLNFNETVMKLYKLGGRDLALDFIETGKARVLTDSFEMVALQVKLDLRKKEDVLAVRYSKASSKTVTTILVAGLLILLLGVVFMMTTIRNIRSANSIMKQLKIAREASEKAVAFKGNFLANMSHEIRTPMNAIVGFAGLLKDTKLDYTQADFVNTIKTAGEDLLVIVNDILDYSKLEAGMMRIESHEFVLDDVLTNVRKLFEQKAAEKELGWQVVLSPDVPQSLIGDSTRLNQILVNLVGNALKFTETGWVKVKVTAGVKQDNKQRIIFTVSDTGIGIPAAKVDAIFERFEQLNNEATRRQTGTGLGLAIVKNLVDIQHGSIRVESTEGKGTSFVFELPYLVGVEKEQKTAAPMEVVGQNVSAVKVLHGTVLLVEDNPMNQKLAAFILKKWGIDFDLANNGIEACEMVAKKPYQLVLMDIQMPEMDGYQATIKIRNELKLTVPIVALTAHAVAAEVEKSKQLGMNGYLTKPFNEEALYRQLSTFLNSSNMNILFNNFTSPTGQFKFLNIQTLLDMSNGNQQFVKEMLQIFQRQVTQEIVSLEKAIVSNDNDRISSIAHSMKGTVGYVGIRPTIAKELDLLEMSRERNGSGSRQECQDAFLRIRKICEETIAEAKQLEPTIVT